MALLPCLCFLSLGVYVHGSHGTPLLPPTYDGSMCTTSFACGGVKIHYPFYLSNTTQVTADYTSYTCGYTDLNVSCGRGEGEAWTPTIRLGGDGYTVKNIFYNNQTIILADSDVLGGGGCPSVRHNVSVGQGWQRNTSSYDNLTFFYGCYAAPRESDPLPRGFDTDKYQINCSGFSDPSGGGVSFVFTSEELRSVRLGWALQRDCHRAS